MKLHNEPSDLGGSMKPNPGSSSASKARFPDLWNALSAKMVTDNPHVTTPELMAARDRLLKEVMGRERPHERVLGPPFMDLPDNGRRE